MPQSIYQGSTYIGETIQRTVGNLLTANQASAETSTTGINSYGTLTRVVGSAVHGSAYLRLTVGAAAASAYVDLPDTVSGLAYWPVTPGESITIAGSVRFPSGTPAQPNYWGPYVVWWNKDGTYLTETVIMPYRTTYPTTWTPVVGSITVPAGAGFVTPRIHFAFAAAMAGYVVELDALGLWYGSGGTWAMPGVPVNSIPGHAMTTHQYAGWVAGGSVRGEEFLVNDTGYCTAIAFFRSSSNTATSRLLQLWTVDGTLLASVRSTETAGADRWVETSLPTPVLLTAGQSYVLSFDTAANEFYAVDNTPTLSDTTALTLVQSRSGTLLGTFPGTPRAGYQDFVDMRFVTIPTWRKAPVWNWVEGTWIQLNADIGPVDFAVRNVAYDRAMIEIHDSHGFDHVGAYRIWLKTGTGAYVRRTDLDIPDPDANLTTFNTQVLPTRWITGLAASTTYSVKMVVDLLSGGVTPDSIQTFTTSANATPLTVIDLRSTARTNTTMDLAWTKPAGSTATSYRVFYGRAGQGPAGVIPVPSASTVRVTGLQENTKYWYYVKGVNASGLEGAKSNQLQWATGWGEIRRQGSDANIIWKPREWGSYRQDIQWQWARENGVKDRNPHLYQGYWPGSNWHGASNPSANTAAGRTRRYWGTVVYTDDTIRDQLDGKHGAGVGRGMVISKLAFRRLYRHTNPGNIAPQDMVWHMTSANPFNSGQPPTYDKYEGNDMKAGEKVDYYRLDKTWGTKLIRGADGGTSVNGIVLHRSDDQTNGYGAAGYGRWSGHLLKDPDTDGSWRYSDLSLMMEGSWNVLVRAYKGPYQW